MKHFLSFLSLLLVTFSLSYANENSSAPIEWKTNYEEAVTLSRSSSKPIVLFFTGSDWCGWCNKLEDEALDTSEFAQEVGDQFIFVKLDFPRQSAQDPKITAQNRELQKKFQVRGFPTIIVLDAEQEPIGLTGYRPGGPKSYAAHLSKMLSDFTAYKKKMQSR